MALVQRIESLEKEHTSLKMKIMALRAHPSVADAELQTLQRKKLNLKDKIAHLRSMETTERIAA